MGRLFPNLVAFGTSCWAGSFSSGSRIRIDDMTWSSECDVIKLADMCEWTFHFGRLWSCFSSLRRPKLSKLMDRVVVLGVGCTGHVRDLNPMWPWLFHIMPLCNSPYLCSAWFSLFRGPPEWPSHASQEASFETSIDETISSALFLPVAWAIPEKLVPVHGRDNSHLPQVR